MDATTYQQEAARTLIAAPPQPLTSQEHMIVWNAIGLAGEAGEVLGLGLYDQPYAGHLARAACGVAEEIKRGVFHERGIDETAVRCLLSETFGYAASLWLVRATLWSVKLQIHPDALLKELGDVCWYAAALCTKFGWAINDVIGYGTQQALGEIWQANIDKLRIRFPVGWSVADAAARVDVGAASAD